MLYKAIETTVTLNNIEYYMDFVLEDWTGGALTTRDLDYIQIGKDVLYATTAPYPKLVTDEFIQELMDELVRTQPDFIYQFGM